MILRRFEMFTVAPGVPAALRAAMTLGMRDCARYVPDILDSAIGFNCSAAAIEVVWEHAYESPAAYRRYMEHSFHANILDRYLTHDSPEKITAPNGLGLDLVGYACETPSYFLPHGARRIVALRLREGAGATFAGIAADAARRAGLAISVFAENTLANRWTDGVTAISGPPVFSHIWEQGFRSLAEAQRFEPGWREIAKDMIENSAEVIYAILPGFNYGAGRA